MSDQNFLNHYQGCGTELQELSPCLTSLLADLDKLAESDPDLLGTTSEIRANIFRQAKEAYSVAGPAQKD